MPDCGIIFLIFICSPFEASLQTPDRSLFMFCEISGGLPSIPSLLTLPANTLNVHWWINHDAFMHAFVISYVRTVLRVLSKYSLACWFGQMLTKAISWMKSSIASPTLRGVPVSLVRPWIWPLFYIRFRYQINLSSLTSTFDEMIFLESCISLPAVLFHHQPIHESVVCLHTTVSCPPLCMIIGVLVIIWLSDRSSTL